MILIWVYSLNTDKKGNFVKKPMRECTGSEVCAEWLYHIGFPGDKIKEYAEDKCNTTTAYMPYINAFFQPRKKSDRPLVVPTGSLNFAFIGQFAQTPRDTIFTTEYSIRTGMEAVYTLLNVDRAVPEVWGSCYDVRELLKAAYYAVDKKSLDELPLSLVEKEMVKVLIKKVKNTDIEFLLKEKNFIINIYHSVSLEILRESLYRLVYPIMYEEIANISKGYQLSEKDKCFITDFYKYAFVAIVLDWVKNDMIEEPRIIVDKVSTLVSGTILHACLSLKS